MQRNNIANSGYYNFLVKDGQVNETVAHLTVENKKLMEELDLKEQLLLSIKSEIFIKNSYFNIRLKNLIDSTGSFNVLTPKKCHQIP